MPFVHCPSFQLHGVNRPRSPGVEKSTPQVMIGLNPIRSAMDNSPAAAHAYALMAYWMKLYPNYLKKA